MANLGTFTVQTNGTYKTLAEVTDLTFTEGNSYQIQILNMAYLREGTTGGGFLVDNSTPIKYTATSDDLYIKNNYGACVVNISE